MRIAITGITGSFGTAFMRQAFQAKSFEVERLVGVSRDELKQSEVATEFGDAQALRLFLGDVRDADRMREAFHHCDTVIHAAALKRVDAISYNPSEVIKTNINGTENVIKAAVECGVKRVLFISSDKACNPLNIYGSSKALAEQIAVASNSYAAPRGTSVSVLRYGNVLASRGSVVHIWRRQKAAGKPASITDSRMTRFVLTLPTAVAYALKAIRQMEGGEIFVPVLESARVTDLARAVVGPDWPVEEIGLRAGGEKLYEALLSDEEPSRTRIAGELMVVTPGTHSWRAQGWDCGDLAPLGFKYVSNGSFGWVRPARLAGLIEESR